MIDEKKMIHTQVYDDEHEEWIEKEMTIAEYLDAYTEEGCPESKLQPCDDAVSREFMYKLGARCIAVRNENDELVAITTIESLPPVTPKQRWIPVSERLPENSNLVLVTAYWHEKYQVMVGAYWGNGVWWCVPWSNTSREHLKMLNAIAWMPLPEPYKEGESE